MKKIYVVKVTDCFGDTWPMTIAGSIAPECSSKEEAEQFVARYKTDKQVRIDSRLIGGYQKNTAKSLQIIELEIR